MGNLVNKVLVLFTLGVVVTAPLLVSSPVHAVSCSGTGCNGKDPIYTGCNQNAYLAKRYYMKDPETGIIVLDIYTDVYYSRTCGTNWIRVTSNPYGGKTLKNVSANGYTHTEIDYGYGSSYSMMVYAPGTTPFSFLSKVYNKSGVGKAWVMATLR